MPRWRLVLGLYGVFAVSTLVAEANGWDVTAAIASVIGTTIVAALASYSIYRWLRWRLGYRLRFHESLQDEWPLAVPYKPTRSICLTGDQVQFVAIVTYPPSGHITACRMRMFTRKGLRWRPASFSEAGFLGFQMEEVVGPGGRGALRDGWYVANPARSAWGEPRVFVLEAHVPLQGWRGALRFEWLVEGSDSWHRMQGKVHFDYKQSPAGKRAAEFIERMKGESH